MKTYKIRLTTYSGILTSFQADTIFGHLCWVVAHRDGCESLIKFLKPFNEGSPPFVISDGFPMDLFPKPLSAEFLFASDKKKEIKKIKFIHWKEFDSIRKCKECEIKEADPTKYKTTPHNKIDRLSWTTPTTGGLYSLEEFFIPYVSVYLKVVSDEWKERVINLFTTLSKTGYGSKKSIGKGQFEVEDIKEFNFEKIKNADGFITLSNFCPIKDDPTEGFYRTFVKYGKLGEEFTFCGNPFKKPLVMIKTGAVFKTDANPKDFYGGIVNNIAPAKPEVVQYAYAFTVPVIFPKT